MSNQPPEPPTPDYNYPGYTAIEDDVPVHEWHRAECNLCDWQGELKDEMDWQGAQAEALEHHEDQHGPDEDEDEDEDAEEEEDESLSNEEAMEIGNRWHAYKEACKARETEPMSWGSWLAAGQPVPLDD